MPPLLTRRLCSARSSYNMPGMVSPRGFCTLQLLFPLPGVPVPRYVLAASASSQRFLCETRSVHPILTAGLSLASLSSLAAWFYANALLVSGIHCNLFIYLVRGGPPSVM